MLQCCPLCPSYVQVAIQALVSCTYINGCDCRPLLITSGYGLTPTIAVLSRVAVPCLASSPGPPLARLAGQASGIACFSAPSPRQGGPCWPACNIPPCALPPCYARPGAR